LSKSKDFLPGFGPDFQIQALEVGISLIPYSLAIVNRFLPGFGSAFPGPGFDVWQGSPDPGGQVLTGLSGYYILDLP
jgi:hypothetical protein